MADLNDLQAAGSTKIVGSDSSGTETNPLAVTQSGEAKVVDGLRSGGVYKELSIPTAGTAVEVKVGSTRLANRKLVTITASTDGLFWGYDSGVTAANGTPLLKGQFGTFSCDPDSTFQVWLVGSTNSRLVRITESA